MSPKPFLYCISITNKNKSHMVLRAKQLVVPLCSWVLTTCMFSMHVGCCTYTNISWYLCSHGGLFSPTEETCCQQSINCVSVYASSPQARVFVWVRICALIINISKQKYLHFTNYIPFHNLCSRKHRLIKYNICLHNFHPLSPDSLASAVRVKKILQA